MLQQKDHCEGLVSMIEVIGTVGLLILVGSAVLQMFWILGEAENSAEKFSLCSGWLA